MTGTEIVNEIVGIITSGITNFATGLGSGIQAFAKALAFEGEGEAQKLSVYFILVLVFAGVALTIGLTTRIFMWLSSLGN